jgi:hypothetical protein
MGFLNTLFHPTYDELKPARSRAEVQRTYQGYVLILINVLVALKVFEII